MFNWEKWPILFSLNFVAFFFWLTCLSGLRKITRSSMRTKNSVVRSHLNFSMCSFLSWLSFRWWVSLVLKFARSFRIDHSPIRKVWSFEDDYRISDKYEKSKWHCINILLAFDFDDAENHENNKESFYSNLWTNPFVTQRENSNLIKAFSLRINWLDEESSPMKTICPV